MISRLLLLLLFAPASVLAQPEAYSLVDSTRTKNLAVARSGTLLATVHSGVLLRSVDDGLTWAEIEIDSTVAAVSIAPCNNSRIYVGTNMGLWFSDDDGLTWRQLGKTQGLNQNILCLPNNDVLVTEGGRLIGVRDSGNSYEQLLAVSEQSVRFVFGRSATSTIVAGYAGCMEDSCGGVAVSRDGGNSFELDTSWVELVPVYSLAVTGEGTINASGFIKRPGDSHWGPSAGGPSFDIDSHLLPIGNDSLIALDRGGLHLSPNGGLTWKEVSSPPRGGADVVVSAAGTMIVGSFTGIWRANGFVTSITSDSPRNPTKPAIAGFPNPATDIVTLTTTGFDCTPNIKVVDALGRVHQSFERLARDFSLELPTVMAASTYFIQACCNARCATTSVSTIR